MGSSFENHRWEVQAAPWALCNAQILVNSSFLIPSGRLLSGDGACYTKSDSRDIYMIYIYGYVCICIYCPSLGLWEACAFFTSRISACLSMFMPQIIDIRRVWAFKTPVNHSPSYSMPVFFPKHTSYSVSYTPGSCKAMGDVWDG